jgi:NADH-quinone oxidoreductase subunit H
MISYELALGLSVIPIFLICGTLNLQDIVLWQRENGWLIAPWWPKGFSIHQIAAGDWSAIGASLMAGFSWQRILIWVPMLLSFIIFLIAMFAETNRVPFDLPEAEQELIGGYHTEYSSMKFALFFLGEYAAMIVGSAVIVTLFFGAWHVPFLPTTISEPFSFWGVVLGLIHITAFFAKVAALLFFFLGTLAGEFLLHLEEQVVDLGVLQVPVLDGLHTGFLLFEAPEGLVVEDGVQVFDGLFHS